MQRLIRFIKYNNSFVIILGLILVSTGGVFANETSRDVIIGKTIITRIGVDNSWIINADLGNFNMNYKITKVTESDLGYNIGYSYDTIYIKDNVWQPLIKEVEMYVSKVGLADKDLGLYIADELGQKADHEIAYLREVQSIEKPKGVSRKIESVEYTGLKGLVFDNNTKKIIGYEPIKEEESKKAEVSGIFNPSIKTETEEKGNTRASDNDVETENGPQIIVVKEVVSKEIIMKMIKEALAEEKIITTDGLPSSTPQIIVSPPSSPVIPVGGEESAQSSLNSSSLSSSSDSGAVSPILESVTSSSSSSSDLPSSSSSSSDLSENLNQSSSSSSEPVLIQSASSSSESIPMVASSSNEASLSSSSSLSDPISSSASSVSSSADTPPASSSSENSF